jgi:hypothetical protein
LAKNDINGRGNILIVGLSTTGPSYFTVGLKSNTFSFTWSETNPFTPVSQIHPTAAAVINPVLNTIGSVLISLGNSVNSLVTNADKFFASLR